MDLTAKAPTKAGELLLISDGAYSDYGVIGLYRAIAPFSARAVLEEYLALHPKERDPYHGSSYAFVAWLTNDRKVIEEIRTTEWHVADYGTFDEEDLPS